MSCKCLPLPLLFGFARENITQDHSLPPGHVFKSQAWAEFTFKTGKHQITRKLNVNSIPITAEQTCSSLASSFEGSWG